jgi:hypothetical protein
LGKLKSDSDITEIVKLMAHRTVANGRVQLGEKKKFKDAD